MALHDKITKQEIEKIVSLYKESKSSHRVAKQIGRSQHAVLRHLHKAVPELVQNNRTTVPNNTRRKKYTVNHNYFETIDTQEKAYILGFIYADGYVNEKGCLEIGLHPKDVSVLEFIKTQLESNALIKFKHNKKSYSKEGLMILQVHSKKITNDLGKLGCVQNKTFKITFPTFLEDTLVRHFVRGYFDGDGCIHLCKRNNGAILNFASNLTFLEGLNKYLSYQLQKDCKRIRKNKNIGYLIFSGKEDIKSIGNLMYTGNTYCLDRKYNKMLKLLN